MKFQLLLAGICALSLSLPAGFAGGAEKESAPDPLDWPNWRGPEQNNTSRETGLVDSWSPKGGPGSNLLWKRSDVGSRSTPIVMRGKLYILARAEPHTKREGERVVCLDAATGETIWEHRFNVYLSEVPDTRVAWSCVVGDPETGRVYALGVCGYFCCLEGDTGKVVWERALHEEYGLLSTYGGRTNIPAIFEDMVLISAVVIGWDEMARPAHRFMAFDKATGQMIWFNGTKPNPYDTTYSTPYLGVLGGQAALVFGSGDGAAWAMQPRTGKPLWNYNLSRRGINTSPIAVGDTVFIGHSEENVKGSVMGNFVAIDGRGSGDLTGKAIWQVEGTMAGKTGVLSIGDRIVSMDDGAKLLMHNGQTGEVEIRKALGTIQRSTPLYADGKIYVCTQPGDWYILRPTADGLETVQKKMRLSGEEVDGSPIASHGRIYLPTSKNLYCIGNADQKPAAEPIPAPPQEKPAGDDDQPALVQVIPCESLLKPGDTQTLTVRLFNARGQLLPNAKAEAKFTVDGPGEVSADGTYTAPADAAHAGVKVTAQVGELKGLARIRVVPPLPWKWDFEGMKDVPITWLGGRVRYVLRESDGQKVMAKRSVIPTAGGKTTKLGTLSYLYMGPRDLHDYTMQADVSGEDSTEKIEGVKSSDDRPEEPESNASPVDASKPKMPDVGLINQGYILALYGAGQKLQINDWSPQQRIAKNVKFAWKPHVWYTLKVTTERDGDKVVVRGKAWPRDETEPQEWMIEVVDEAPNRTGTPGIFGNTKDAEVHLDNITVTPNEK